MKNTLQNNKRRRLTSAVLSLVMAIGMFSAGTLTTFAQEAGSVPSDESSAIKAGDTTPNLENETDSGNLPPEQDTIPAENESSSETNQEKEDAPVTTEGMHSITFYNSHNEIILTLWIADGETAAQEDAPAADEGLSAGWYPKQAADEYALALEEYTALAAQPGNDDTPQQPPEPTDFGQPYNWDAPVQSSIELKAAYLPDAPLAILPFGAEAEKEIFIPDNDTLVLTSSNTAYLASSPETILFFNTSTSIRAAGYLIEVQPGVVATLFEIVAYGPLQISGGGLLYVNSAGGKLYQSISAPELRVTGNTTLNAFNNYYGNAIVFNHLYIEKGSIVNAEASNGSALGASSTILVEGALHTTGNSSSAVIRVMEDFTVDGGTVTATNTKYDGIAIEVTGQSLTADGSYWGYNENTTFTLKNGAHVTALSPGTGSVWASGLHLSNLKITGGSTLMVDAYVGINAKFTVEVNGQSTLLVNTQRELASLAGVNVQGEKFTIHNSTVVVGKPDNQNYPKSAFEINGNHILTIHGGAQVSLYGQAGIYNSKRTNNLVVIDNATVKTHNDFYGLYFEKGDNETRSENTLIVKNGAKVTFNGNYYGIYATLGSKIEASGTGTKLSANGVEPEGKSYGGIWVNGSLTAHDNAEITGTSLQENNGISAGIISAAGGTIIGKSPGRGLFSASTITATQNSTITGHGAASPGIYANGIIQANTGSRIHGESIAGLGIFTKTGLTASGSNSEIIAVSQENDGMSVQTTLMANDMAHIESTTKKSGKSAITGQASLTANNATITANAIDWASTEETSTGGIVLDGTVTAQNNGSITENFQTGLVFTQQNSNPFASLASMADYNNYQFTTAQGSVEKDSSGSHGIHATAPAEDTTLTATRTQNISAEKFTLTDGGRHSITTRPVTLDAPPLPSYTVTFDNNREDTSHGLQSLPAKAPAYTTGALPDAPLHTGHTFTGWNTAKDGSGTEFTADTKVSGNITVYAQWQAVAPTPPAGGTATTPPASTPTPENNTGTPAPENNTDIPSVADAGTPPNETPAEPPAASTPAHNSPAANSTPQNITQTEAPAAEEPAPLATDNLAKGGIPLYGFTSGAWSLANLLAAQIGLCTALFMGLDALRRRKQQSAASMPNKTLFTLLKIGAALAGLGTGLLFIMLETFSSSITWFNNWSLIILPVFVLHSLLLGMHQLLKRRTDTTQSAAIN